MKAYELRNNYNATLYGCYLGYIVQAIVNNFLPLCFVVIRDTYGISLAKVTFLITFNFGIQLLVDFLSAFFVDRIGYRASMLIAHIVSAAGFVTLGLLPQRLSDPYAGIVLAVILNAIGGGLLEVLVSPIVEACPTENKEKAMSLLHSFYCWGHMGVVIITTVFFRLFGIQSWTVMAIIWAVIPLANTFVFSQVPIRALVSGDERGLSFKELAGRSSFWILFMMMICSGASEQAVSQWASTFVERGLDITKTAADIAGPMMFALAMGLSRLFYGKYGERIELRKFMVGSSVLCLLSYILIFASKSPVIGITGCILCGFSVGILWPGTFSLAAASVKKGGTILFALLALAGDVGCGGGPTYVGLISSAFGDDLRIGTGLAVIFPIGIIIGIWLLGPVNVTRPGSAKKAAAEK
ncbi:MAG TPA: MFS transporter [Lachnospiraceae bacterium]|nr:MFS transporter [Lachnospiraceae bacterium]